MLKKEEMRVYEVAHEVGYDDFRHFSKMFKKYEGISPKEWAANIEYQQRQGERRS